jgi:hypothetical protein
MDRYAHVGVRDTAGAVEKLSLPSPVAHGVTQNAPAGTASKGGEAGAATGAADSDDEQGPAETSGETPSVVANNNPPESLGKEGFRGQVRTGEKVHPRGVEHPANSPTKTALLATGGAESGALPPELLALVEVWPKLPEHIRAAIRALVTSAASA